ncbi:methyl-accepting chemotaxis protein [Paenibacillus xanthanilyticus]|uniref:Methyl-accepting chemotaxis protein n=1 Tax=Paenibacillus xanthanilyticus TaxID=1783531 RepID=A0ABV8KD85_9BACL
MKRLNYLFKFLVIGIILLVPLVTVSVLYGLNVNASLQVKQEERKGMAYLQRLEPVFASIIAHRSMLVTDVRTEAQQAQIQAVQQQAAAAIQALDQVAEGGAIAGSADQWERVKRGWAEIVAESADLSPTESLSWHKSLLDDVLRLVDLIRNEQHLVLDSSLDLYYLKDNATRQLPFLLEQTGELQARSYRVAFAQALEDTDRKALEELLNAIRMTNRTLAANTQTMLAADRNPQLAALMEANSTAVTGLVDKLNAGMINSSRPQLSGEELTALFGGALGSLQKVSAYQTQLYSVKIADAIDDGRRDLLVVTIAMTAVIAAAFYLFLSFYWTVRANVNELRGASERLAEGDLTARVELDTKDEMKHIAHAFNRMGEAFRTMIGANKEMSAQVALASDNLASSSGESSAGSERIVELLQRIASGSDEQEATATGTSRVIGEMTAGIAQMASASDTVAQSASEAEAAALSGVETVRQASRQMEEIGRSVEVSADIVRLLSEQCKEIDAIVNFISEIASQTQLLALNASIEAARAGEHGAGFMVVATEVRNLAEQTKQSAGRIVGVVRAINASGAEALQSIEAGVSEAGKGRQSMADTAAAFERIKEAVRSAAVQMQEVSAASRQMASSTQSVSEAIADMVHVASEAKAHTHAASASSQEQLAIMEEITASSEDLRATAHELQQLIARFNV